MEDERPASEARIIWILTSGRVGDLKQMQELASALGWPATVKRLVFRPPHIPFLARLLMDRSRSDRLEPPWPDLVLCAEGRTSVVARFLQQKSHGAIKTVCLGRPAGSPAEFDLVLTTAQYRLPKAPQVIELGLPITSQKIDGELDESGAQLIEPGQLDRPVTAVLIGGKSLPEWLDAAAAARLAAELVEYARKTGGTLLLSTSPRTDKPAAGVFAKLIHPPHMVHQWHGEGDNPYRRFLKLADVIIVTSDSVSMVVDALATGKPVSVYRLEQRRSLWHRIVEALYKRAWVKRMRSPWMKPVKWLFDRGIIEVPADRPLLFDRLAAERRLRWFDEQTQASPQARPTTDDRATAIAAVKKLFSEPV